MSFPSEKSEAMPSLQPLAESRELCSHSKSRTLQDTLVLVLLPEMTSGHGSVCLSVGHFYMIYNRFRVASQTTKANGKRVRFGRDIVPETKVRRLECNRFQLALSCQSTGGIWGS